MKILIIDDSDSKSLEICKLVSETEPTATVERAMSFRGGIRALENSVFDLLLLDLMLPIRDGESPTHEGGLKVLSEIKDANGILHPSHIVCVTAYDRMAEAFKDEAQRSLVHVVLFDEMSDKWRSSLRAKLQSIIASAKGTASAPSFNLCELAIVTSSPMVELQELLKIPGFQGCFHQDDALQYFTANWETAERGPIQVVACAAPVMGMTAACATATKVINRWRPQYLAMTGIAAGTNSTQQYGDILVGEAAYDYGSGKIVETEAGERLFIPSHRQIPLDSDLHAILQHWERDQIAMQSIQKSWYAPLSHTPRMTLGILASGAAVVQDKKLVQEILNQSRKVVGLDMEAFGIFHAAHLATHPKPKVIVAKSVSDFADKRKNDEWQRYAAFTSARFIYEFFTCASNSLFPSDAKYPRQNGERRK